ncbi:MAG: hypothetical protein GY938_22545 [Ketobacter sp.]|nr:hypothetical protein [Planctomycetota bacterium]MCP5018025.1 hypothetical protein [Ketobacter sp.]
MSDLMVYAPNGDKGGVESNGYWYLVIDSEKKDKFLSKGWYESPAKLPKKKAAKK